jgi:hypothetical protein
MAASTVGWCMLAGEFPEHPPDIAHTRQDVTTPHQVTDAVSGRRERRVGRLGDQVDLAELAGRLPSR